MFTRDELWQAVRGLSLPGRRFEGSRIEKITENGKVKIQFSRGPCFVSGTVTVPFDFIYEATRDFDSPRQAAAIVEAAIIRSAANVLGIPRDYKKSRERLRLVMDQPFFHTKEGENAPTVSFFGMNYYAEISNGEPEEDVLHYRARPVTDVMRRIWDTDSSQLMRDAIRGTQLNTEICLEETDSWTGQKGYRLYDPCGRLGAGVIFLPGMARQISRRTYENFTACFPTVLSCAVGPPISEKETAELARALEDPAQKPIKELQAPPIILSYNNETNKFRQIYPNTADAQ